MELWESWTKEELEKQMSPSRWNPTKSADEVISQHISVCTDETKKARQRIPCMLDISYGASDTQKYDLYATDLTDNAPVVFWIHGGYWQEGSKDISGMLAVNLHSIGTKTIVMEYTLAPKATVKQILTEMFMALSKAMREHKTAKFIVGGHSAGGQLAAMILHETSETLDKDRIVGLLLFSGVYDLRPLVNTYVNDALKLTSLEAELMSPMIQPFDMTRVNGKISVLLCVGRFDSPEFQRQTQAYTAKLSKVVPNVQLWISAKDDHFTLVENLFRVSDCSRRVLNFLSSTTPLEEST